MKKKSSKTLFNKNHISITKNIDTKSIFKNRCVVRRMSTGTVQKNEFIKIEKESKLGFYYYSEERVDSKPENKEVVEIEVSLKNGVSYIITYVDYFNGTPISRELRPWDIADDKSMPEHFVFDLKKILDDILDEIKENKCDIFNQSNRTDYTWFKDMIYTDFFGDKVGIRFQTNEEKILSHGFDLKTSFRKEKENNK